MAHEIASVNGMNAFYSAKVPAWHGLGQVVETAQSSADAIKLAGLDWDVSSIPLTAKVMGGAFDGMECTTDDFGHFRQDGDQMVHLGTVKGRYKLVQNRDAFGFVDSLHADGVLKYETAGALGRGERIFLSAFIPSSLDGGDKVADSEIRKYLLLFNSHDGSSALEVMPTTTRVVCANTLRVARGGCAEKLCFRHCSSIDERMDQASRMMDLASKDFTKWMQLARIMAAKDTGAMTYAEIETAINTLYPKPKDDATKLAKERHSDRVSAFWDVYNGEPTNANIKGTAWGVLNAVTFLEDHGDAILKGDKAQGRFLRAMEGTGNTVKVAAWNLLSAPAMAMVA